MVLRISMFKVAKPKNFNFIKQAVETTNNKKVSKGLLINKKRNTVYVSPRHIYPKEAKRNYMSEMYPYEEIML